MPALTNQTAGFPAVSVSVVQDSAEAIGGNVLLEELIMKLRLIITHLSLVTEHELTETDILEE